MKKVFPILIFSLFCICNQVFSQLVLENNPTSIKWNSIKTPNFRVIFPTDYRNDAIRTTQYLDSIYIPASLSLGEQPRPINIILQNQGAISNGFVTYAPRRSEFFTFAPQNPVLLGTNDWMEQLAIHEYRHVVQFDRTRKGFNKLVNILLGPWAASGMAHLALPDWFWEGDAVVIETALTESGRGRNPQFGMALKMNMLERKTFGYHKQYLGSFKHYVTDHYVLGFHLTGFLRQNHGAKAIETAVGRSAAWSFVPFTFSSALKKQTGNHVMGQYELFAKYMIDFWKQQAAESGKVPYEKVIGSDRTFTNYHFPILQPDGSIIALKEGLSHYSQFVRINPDGAEKHLFTPGLIVRSLISYNNDQLLWCEYEFDPRWPMRSYGAIKMLNVETGKHKRITKNSKYTTAALSPDGSKVAAVGTNPDGTYTIEVIRTSDGVVTKSLANPKNDFYLSPFWATESELIVIAQQKNDKKIIAFDVENDSRTVLHDAGNENIYYAKKYDNYLFYNSPHSGIDNIYLKNLEDGNVYKVTDAIYGAFNADYDRETNTLIYNYFGKNGFEVVKTKIDPDSWVKKEDVKVWDLPFVDHLVKEEQELAAKEHTAHSSEYHVNAYPKAKGTVNPYWWGISPISTSASDPVLRFHITSQDMLSNHFFSGGYEYDVNENSGEWSFNYSYQGLYPILDFNFGFDNRSVLASFNDTLYSSSWTERGIDVGLRIPFNFTHNRFFQNLSVAATFSGQQISNYGFIFYDDLEVRDNNVLNHKSSGNLYGLGVSANYSILHKRAKRDIFPKYGLRALASVKSTPFGGDYQSSQFGIQGTLYLPGLLRHNSFRIRGAYTYQNINNYVFRSPIASTRGYSLRVYDEFSQLTLTYGFPIWYPDVALGPFVNIQRIWLDAFYDIGRGIRNSPIIDFDNEDVLESFGADLVFDFNVFRQRPIFSLGLRYIYLPREKVDTWQVVVYSIPF